MKGYDYAVLEKYAKYVHNTADRIGLEVEDRFVHRHILPLLNAYFEFYPEWFSYCLVGLLLQGTLE